MVNSNFAGDKDMFLLFPNLYFGLENYCPAFGGAVDAYGLHNQYALSIRSDIGLGMGGSNPLFKRARLFCGYSWSEKEIMPDPESAFDSLVIDSLFGGIVKRSSYILVYHEYDTINVSHSIGPTIKIISIIDTSGTEDVIALGLSRVKLYKSGLRDIGIVYIPHDKMLYFDAYFKFYMDSRWPVGVQYGLDASLGYSGEESALYFGFRLSAGFFYRYLGNHYDY